MAVFILYDWQETVKFNQQLSVNRKLRQEIDHLRQDRLVFNSLFKKLTKELDDIKKSINEIVTEASQAYEERYIRISPLCPFHMP